MNCEPPLHEAPSRTEVKQLWWFTDGAIMDPGTREHLWRARGLCPRHSWMFFCAETELKYQPLGVAVLYEDLAGRVVRGFRRRRATRHAFEATGSCFTCDYVATARGDDDHFGLEAAALARAARTREWISGSEGVWSSVVCPDCRIAAPRTEGIRCRLHARADDLGRLRTYLPALQHRLRTCVRSMTADGPDRSADSDAALVEALAWFAGWRAGTSYLRRREGGDSS